MERNTKHSAMRDDEMAGEVEGMVRAGRATHADEFLDPEPAGEDEPAVDRSAGGTLTGGTPEGVDADTVQLRAELARWLDRADFPATGGELVEAARDHRAPDAVADELAKLPAGETFTRIGEVVRALGHETEAPPPAGSTD
ncbi:DUF2795 domain-containing protein [Modestobacter sp. Leaf380]|uniref:DUF2795 domain-containing protein n=1 Tax=Modestobacter sp. Leaf380 TaxID=1736356 RepID=UPI001F34BBAB|nr:DUF2795 domain-containing protein [Modestobacter sp. Leaf380]